MSMGVGRFFPDFDNYQGEDETQIVNETIPVSIASMLWYDSTLMFLFNKLNYLLHC